MRSGAAAAPTDAGRIAAGSPQNADIQILVIDTSVSRLPTIATATSTSSRLSIPAVSSPSLATNPENGGMPDRLSAGRRNSAARKPERWASPLRRSRRLVPALCSTIPSTRNSDVFTGIWWIRKKIVAAIAAGPPMAMPSTM